VQGRRERAGDGGVLRVQRRPEAGFLMQAQLTIFVMWKVTRVLDLRKVLVKTKSEWLCDGNIKSAG
jgi:hypothetical protein